MRIILCLLLLSFGSIAQNLSKDLDITIQKHFVNKEVGGVFMLINDGKVVYKYWQGKANIQSNIAINQYTNFRMASVSKQFTAACIMILKNQGKLSYDDNLMRFFPLFNQAVGAKIKIRHLLTHTSGILDYEELIPKNFTAQVLDEAVVNLLATENRVYFETGSQFRYSNSGFCILAQIVEIVSGLSYTEFIEQNIFQPLKMKNTYLYDPVSKMPLRALGYAQDSTGKVVLADQSITSATKGDGCIYTSLNDYQIWLKAIQQGTLFQLKKELEQINYTITDDSKMRYGMGWFNTITPQNGLELYHSGSTSGFSNGVYFVPDKQFAFVYFTNLADNHGIEAKLIDILKTNKLWTPSFDFKSALGFTR
jgi:CubicO group peptidase (beta-lactamase class C family)